MITNFDSLADRLKGIKLNGEDITPQKLIDAINDEKELEIEAAKVSFLTEDQIAELKNNVKKDGYEEGKNAGSEMTIKELKRKWGIEKEGKSIESLFNYVNDKVLTDAKIEPESKVKELTHSLENLQNKYTQDLTDWEQKYNQKESEIMSIKQDSIISQKIPAIEGYKRNHLMAAFKADGFGVKIEEGNIVPTKNGNPIKNELENYESADNVINNWLADSGYIKHEGRGGSTQQGGGFNEFKTMDDVMKHLEKNKIDPMSNQGNQLINKFQDSQI